MATYDMTSSDTVGVGANSIAVLPPKSDSHVAYTIEATLDIDDMVLKGYSGADGDIFQLLEIPAGCLVINAGAEVMKAFNSSVTADIDFAAGDDIIDGADVTSTGFCAKGTNGQTNVIGTGAASTYTQFVSTTDTIDVLLAGAAPTTGRLRVYATVVDCNEQGAEPAAAARDALA
jgi:hypothetical protein|tara:strand:- start:1586 stop:2110 length:525 start_codon:yes stop_codon:yes gene_type:complete